MTEPTSGTTYELDYDSWEAFKEAVGLDELKRGDRLIINVKSDSQYRAEYVNSVAGHVQVRVFGARDLPLHGLIDPEQMTITVR